MAVIFGGYGIIYSGCMLALFKGLVLLFWGMILLFGGYGSFMVVALFGSFIWGVLYFYLAGMVVLFGCMV